LKNRLIYLFILFQSYFLNCQTKDLFLARGNCSLFNGSLYCFGLVKNNPYLQFKLYKLNDQLAILDSNTIDLGKAALDNYLSIFSDTLHDHLNIYISKKEKKAVSVLRFNKRNELTANIEHVDIARLNNIAMFDNDVYYFANQVYAIKIISDSSGRQFYLNKYTLKSETGNFDYEFKWQFPFERKNIHSTKIIYAGKQYVLLFVNVIGSAKEGQWVLRVNATTGKLIKGTKLNDKMETATYHYGTHLFDTGKQTIYLVGQKFTDAQFSLKEKRFNIANVPFAVTYLAEIDSTGELVAKQDFKIPIREIKTGTQKGGGKFILRFHHFVKSPEGKFVYEADVYKNSDKSFCFQYSNSTTFKLTPGEEKLVMEKNEIVNNLDVEHYIYTLDKLDMNGKLCVDSLNEFEKLYYKRITLPVKLDFKYDSLNNPVWLLTKSSVKKNSINYSFLKPIKKTYQVSSIEEINKSQDPLYLRLSEKLFLIGSQTEEEKFRLKTYNW
jgi:hypothetical protein